MECVCVCWRLGVRGGGALGAEQGGQAVVPLVHGMPPRWAGRSVLLQLSAHLSMRQLPSYDRLLPPRLCLCMAQTCSADPLTL